MRHAVIRMRVDEPNHSDIPETKYDWEYTCYHVAEELIPEDCPRPLGKRVLHACYVDANLQHDLISGKSCTGVLHMANKSVVDFSTKLQATVETATFGQSMSQPGLQRSRLSISGTPSDTLVSLSINPPSCLGTTNQLSTRLCSHTPNWQNVTTRWHTIRRASRSRRAHCGSFTSEASQIRVTYSVNTGTTLQ